VLDTINLQSPPKTGRLLVRFK